MCLAVPARVISLDESAQTAVVALANVRKEISIALLDAVAVDDYVLLHVGYAINKIRPEEAERTLTLMEEAGILEQAEGPAA